MMGEKGRGCAILGFTSTFCDHADQFGHERSFMSCCHGVQLEDLVPLDDVLAPALLPVEAFGSCFGIAREGAYQFGDAVKFIVESVGRGLRVLETRENGRNVTLFRGMAFVASDMGWL